MSVAVSSAELMSENGLKRSLGRDLGQVGRDKSRRAQKIKNNHVVHIPSIRPSSIQIKSPCAHLVTLAATWRILSEPLHGALYKRTPQYTVYDTRFWFHAMHPSFEEGAATVLLFLLPNRVNE
ncbi:hypothetical protein DEO72_LG6g1592 [Vigna unguiculata]|uniref:Uncharacterized protein n=1 Tax=Vigna unguiculata TaxID=3917 RepID=A0A4D6M6E3_VIGUN|nr:hypothetical protein DEO72_LG6g1592 [Vigna unguiculata]